MKTNKDTFMYALGISIVIGFFILLYLLSNSAIPQDNNEIMHLMAGALIGSFTGVVNYFFGSSKGSQDKTELLSKK